MTESCINLQSKLIELKIQSEKFKKRPAKFYSRQRHIFNFSL